MVRVAEARGLHVYRRLSDVPGCESLPEPASLSPFLLLSPQLAQTPRRHRHWPGRGAPGARPRLPALRADRRAEVVRLAHARHGGSLEGARRHRPRRHRRAEHSRPRAVLRAMAVAAHGARAPAELSGAGAAESRALRHPVHGTGSADVHARRRTMERISDPTRRSRLRLATSGVSSSSATRRRRNCRVGPTRSPPTRSDCRVRDSPSMPRSRVARRFTRRCRSC